MYLSSGFFDENILLPSVLLRKTPYDGLYCCLYIRILTLAHEDVPWALQGIVLIIHERANYTEFDFLNVRFI